MMCRGSCGRLSLMSLIDWHLDMARSALMGSGCAHLCYFAES